ncbi:MAG: hypothetical protein SGILL_000034 [Bacillariaceae sp.]
MAPNVHPAAWELLTQEGGRHRRYSNDNDDSDSSWEEREHSVLVLADLQDDRKRLQQQQQEPQQWPFFKKDDADGLSPQLVEALSSVRVLDDPKENQEWLEQHKGCLADLSPKLLEGLRKHAPRHFSARVADFNDNLYYHMQQQRGLDHYDLEDDAGVGELQDFLNANEYLGSFLSTESSVPQPPHVDYTYDVLQEHAENETLKIGFFPLTKDGMFLQIWPTSPSVDPSIRIEGEIVHIPYGKLLVVPASTIHGGGFRTSSREDAGLYGNLRFHLYIATKEATLPVHQNNKYTEPHDKSKELSRRYVDSNHMATLMDALFV